jgi:hypothetical protein
MRRLTVVIAIASCVLSFVAGAAPLAFVANKAGAFAGGSVQAFMTAIASARLTRPGVDDIVVSRGVFPPTPATNIPLRLLAPQADGTVADVTTAAFGPTPPARVHPREIVFGDINRDGVPDVFVAAHGYDQAPFTGEANALLLSQPGGSFTDASALLPATPDFSHSAVVGDINGDGNPDVCVINIYGQLLVGPYCLLGNGGTAFVAGGKLPSSITSLAQKYTTSLMLDVDRDGHADLVLGADANATSVVLFNDGAGDFTKRASWSFPAGLFGTTTINLCIAVIDINADGFPDLLFSQTSLNYVGHAVQVLVNDQHGAFVDETATYLPGSTALTGAWLQFIRVLDLNGDGIPDIYAQGVSGIAPSSNPVVFAWVSDGPGHYVPVDSSVIGGTFPFMVAFVDQDRDGLPDLISLSNGPLGQINYQTFRNVTARATKIVWRHTSGIVSVWLVRDTGMVGSVSLGGVGSDWTIAGIADFDGDGSSDILWRNTSGLVCIWLLSDAGRRDAGCPGSAGADWTIQGVGDFDGDGKADILWRHASGIVYLWRLDGTRLIGSGSPGSAGGDWTIQGVGDFDGDGKADILWRHASGVVYIWRLDGFNLIGSGSPGSAGADWTIEGVGDFDGDGKSDILWRHVSGTVYIWRLDGTSRVAAGSPGGVGTDWTIAGVSTFDGDRKADILWRHTSGLVYIWRIDGTSLIGSGSPGSAGVDWQIE